MKTKTIIMVLLAAYILASCAPSAKVVPAEIAILETAIPETPIPTSTLTSAPVPPATATIAPTETAILETAIPETPISTSTLTSTPVPPATATIAPTPTANNGKPSRELLTSSVLPFAKAWGLDTQQVIDRLVLIEVQGKDQQSYRLMVDPGANENEQWANTPLLIQAQDDVWNTVTLKSMGKLIGLPIGATSGYKHVEEINTILKTQFDALYLDYDVQWNNVEAEKGKRTYSNNYAYPYWYIDFSKHNTLLVEGGSLIFWQTYPAWLKEGSYSDTEIGQFVREHISQTIIDFPDINIWTVANEFHPVQLGWHEDYLQEVLGSYLIDVFTYAREVSGDKTLIYNDNGNEIVGKGNQPRNIQIVNVLKENGLIDGIGLHMHLDGNTIPTADELRAGIESYGIPAYITELDVNMREIEGTQQERFVRQAQIYENVTKACAQSEKCKILLTYNIGDKYSWLETCCKSDSRFGPDADATIFDDNFEPKPAFFAMLKALFVVLEDPNEISLSR